MASLTLKPGALIIASAYPDPPFELADGSETGFDIDLMRSICKKLGLVLQRERYQADNFDGIFDGLAKRSYDAVISGTTITPDRSKLVLFSDPYLEFNQGVAINRLRTPNVSTDKDLRGFVAGIQSGNTSEFVAQRWLAAGLIGKIQYYPYDGIMSALADLESGKIGLMIKLFPVISWLIRDRPNLQMAMQVPTHEQLGIAFAKDNVELCKAVNEVLQDMRNDGELTRLQSQWFSLAAHA